MTALEQSQLGGTSAMVECRAKGHCWHLWSLDLLSTPGTRIEKCCWCGGETRSYVRSDPYGDLKTHGPHRHE